MWNLMGVRAQQLVRLPRVPVLTFNNLKGMALHDIVTYLKTNINHNFRYVYFHPPPPFPWKRYQIK